MRFILILISCFIFANAAQKLADEPRDRPIQVRDHSSDKVYCYDPSFSKGDGYIYLNYCEKSKSARYDVFERISYHINNTWLCLTAPSSVTGTRGSSAQEWDYVVLRPCVLNDSNQRWKIQDGGIYTADGKYRIKHYNYYAFISKNPKDYYDHTLTSNMNTWKSTIARPGNLSIKTFITWSFITQSEWILYYLQNNASYADAAEPIYYNPENGHFTQYEKSDGSLLCMTSNTAKFQDWNWVSWERCNDLIPSSPDKHYWEPFMLTGNEGMLKDAQGNFLRITQYGSNWGVPYSVKGEYFAKDTSNSPKSNFIFTPDFGNWNLFVNANNGDNLTYCPAPGTKNTVKVRVKRSLPPSFQLTEEWVERLWGIATTASSTQGAIGICGVCLLQSLEMIAQLQGSAFTGYTPTNGYFFPPQSGGDPATLLRSRFPSLANLVEGTMGFFNLPYQTGESYGTRHRRVVQSIAMGMLPQYQWHVSDIAENMSSIHSLIQSLYSAPTGTLWFYFVIRSNASGTGRIGHTQPILRTDQGLVTIPTNRRDLNLDGFRDLLNPITDPNDFINTLSLNGQRNLYLFGVFQVTQYTENPFNLELTTNNCDGMGDHRRGNGRAPLSSLVNQCSTGRCSIQ